MESGIGEWYFFSPPKYKYPNSILLDRKTRGGYWKVKDKPSKIKSRNGTVIGEKTTLVFHKGSTRNGERTPWFLYQYNLISDLPNQKKRVFLWKLKKKDDGKANASSNEIQPSCYFPCVAEEDNTNANAISLDDLGGFEMPETGQGALPQMRSDESQPSYDNGMGLEDLEDLTELGDGQIADVVSHLPPKMKSIYDEKYDSLLSELQPQTQGEQQQLQHAASSSSWGFALSNDSSRNTPQNHCYSVGINQDFESQPQMQWEQQPSSSSWSIPLSNDSQNHYYSGDTNEEEDMLLFWHSPQFNEAFLAEGSSYHT